MSFSLLDWCKDQSNSILCYLFMLKPSYNST